ncbi:hypothetical protein O3M35_003078 [Rhynocoris fuscipes]|uniref:Uncharacterized protein n=1 Tax=Rhynocoris fuscipes TaxID=488301 RepID=A0AAW1CHT3_9HEMI
MQRLKAFINEKNTTTNNEDAPKFITGLEIFVYIGLIRNENSLISSFAFILTRIWFIVGAIFFLKPIFMPDKTLEMSETVNLIHYALFNIGCLASATAITAKTEKFKSFCQLLQDEFKQSKLKLSKSQEEIIINKTNKSCWKLFKILSSFYCIAATTNCFKGPLLEGLPFPFKGWVPFRTDDSFM